MEEIAKSGKWLLDKVDIKKIIKGALIAAGGAVFVYLAQYLQDGNFGIYTPLATAAASILINISHRLMTDNKSK